MIELCNISKHFGKQTVLQDISFTLNKGEVTAFLGINGAGKTTTMNIITGILAPDAGKVLVDGVNVSDAPTCIKQKIGYLSEDNPLYGDMYVREYLEYVGAIYLNKNQIKESVEKLIEKLDLKDEYRKKINTLSHGNRQRVGLAQALVHEPEILILDEPTNGLDPNQQFKINRLISEIGKSTTLLFSSHRLEDVAEVASRYIFIHNGKIEQDDSTLNIESLKEYFYTI